jgi:hypothetical protein
MAAVAAAVAAMKTRKSKKFFPHTPAPARALTRAHSMTDQDDFSTRAMNVMTTLRNNRSCCQSCRFCIELRNRFTALQQQFDALARDDSHYPLISSWCIIDSAAQTVTYLLENLATFAPMNARHKPLLAALSHTQATVNEISREFWPAKTLQLLSDASLFRRITSMTEKSLCGASQLLRFCARLTSFIVDNERCKYSDDGTSVTVFTHAFGTRPHATSPRVTARIIGTRTASGLKKDCLERLSACMVELRKRLLQRAPDATSGFGNF